MNHSASRSPKDYIRLVLCGCCMGAADIVPGVSGGTMAFILGIYDELIDSIRAFGKPETIKQLVRLRVRAVWQAVNAPFLLAVGSGIALSILTLAHILVFFLDRYPQHVWATFFGLVLASVFLVGRRVRRWSPPRVGTFAVGAVVAYVIVGLVPMQTPETWWFLLFAGAVAICAMILPGISGAFLLLLLGKYEFMLQALNSGDIGSVAIFFIGAAVGIVSFAHVLSWFLHHHHDSTVALLTGLMLGSLRHIWPWTDPAGSSLILFALASLAAVAVWFLDHCANRPAASGT